MSVISVYNPAKISVAGKSRIVIMPAVADINAITLAEWNAGTAVECATDSFGIRTNVSFTSSQMLCDTAASQEIGERTYELADALQFVLDDLQSTTDPELLAKLDVDNTIFLGHRPGMDHTAVAAADQRYEGAEAVVAAVDLVPISTEAGQKYRMAVQLAIRKRTSPLLQKLVA